jgi:hypothetical protein
MKKYINSTLLILCFILFSGCTDYSPILQTIVVNNKKVESQLDGYSASKTTGSTFESVIITSISSGDYVALTNSKLPGATSFLSDKLTTNIDSLRSQLMKTIERSNFSYDVRKEDGEEGLTPRIDDVHAFLLSISSVHYFLKRENGIVEQVFLFYLPTGSIYGLSLYLFGGEYIDSKTIGLN